MSVEGRKRIGDWEGEGSGWLGWCSSTIVEG